MLPSEPAIRQVTLDFQRRAVDISINPACSTDKSCVLHWTQAVWGKVSEIKQHLITEISDNSGQNNKDSTPFRWVKNL